MIAVRLPEDIERRLSDLARKTGRTKTFYVREAVQAHLEDLEDLYLAEQEVKNLRAGRSTTTPLAEVVAQVNKRLDRMKDKRPPR